MEEMTCKCSIIHEDRIKQVKNEMLNEDEIIDLSELFKVFGDSTRMKIILALKEAELCVCDIASMISSSVSAVSHQLRILKQAKLVKYKKVGKEVYYTLDDHHVYEIIEKGCEHIEEL